ncbi:hypothetical protein [Streptomyces ortus]|uniref:Uncharacterized protein n=1 Tax=Streptomyces ortus TaxID=2867268 RepID=A0ABT3UX17_9ACTN|nr:hypothetical protein [Streptomyces ortus]MCX4232109.1 hypothetical protein [Streptomyces ortus]
MTRPIRDLDTPLDRLEQQVADLVARQNEQRADESAERLRGFFAGQPLPTRRTATEETP